MKQIQLIYPWTHPFILTIIICCLLFILVLGFVLLYFSVKKVRSKKFKIILIIVAIPMVLYPAINFVGYKIIEHRTFKKYVGSYIDQNQVNKLVLKRNNNWISYNFPFECDTGTWELKITEDGTYIELSCKESKYFFKQLWPSKDFSISVLKDNFNIVVLQKQ